MQKLTLKAKGLYSFPNLLSSVPSGALTQADNIVINRDAIIEPRRGFKIYGNAMGSGSTDYAHQLLIYKNRILRHFGGTGAGTTLQFDDGTGTFTSFSTSVAEVSTGLRVKGVESNGNLYLTTSAGIKKISSSSAANITASSISSAGGIKALDTKLTLSSTTGFFTQESKVAYRIIWGIKDANNNIIVGSPSERSVIDNPLTDLLINDFNQMLVDLDSASAVSGADTLSDTNYLSTWKVPVNSDTTLVQTNMSGVCTKLNTDIGGTPFTAIKAAIDAIILSSPVTTAQLLSLQTQFDAMIDKLNSLIGTDIDITVPLFSNSTQSATVNLNFTIPTGITTAHFYQIFRTALATSSGAISLNDIDPGDETGLVYEGNPTSGEISQGYINIQDIVPDSFRGENLYTNPNSGEGIAQANEVPPKAKDISLYKNFMFYANTETKYRKQLSLLSVSSLTSGTSTFTITDGTTTNTYTFQTGVAEVSKAQTVADVAGSLNNKYFTINAANDTTQYYVWYSVNGAGVDPAIAGKTGIKVSIATGANANTVASTTQSAINNFGDFTATVSTNTVTITNINKGICTNSAANTSGFTVTTFTDGKGEDVANKKILISSLDTPAQEVDETARSIVRVINRNSSELVYAYYLSGPNDVPGLILFESRILGGNAFYFNVNSTATGTQFSPTLPTSSNSVISDNEVSPNRLYYSKQYQPDAVPLLNYFDVGPKDKKILRVLALRNSLFVLKEEGIYRISGEEAPFIFNLFDSSTILTAPDTASVLNNQIYLLSSQGVAKIDDNGVEIISRPIEGDLIKLAGPSYSNYSTASHGCSYESDRTYYLWTVTNTNDSKATQCFRYNTFTEAWVRSDISKTCAINNPSDDKLYLGAADTNFIEQERKNFDRTDYADRQYDFTLGSSSVDGITVTMPSVTNVEERDVIIQVQYLTLNQYNRLLMKLDGDVGVADSNYSSLLGAAAGSNLRTKLTSLAQKLDNDAGVTNNNYASTISGYSSSFSDIQLAFNAIVNKLNLDSGVSLTNYQTSTGTISYEIVITSVTPSTNKITTEYAYPFIAGLVTVYKHINSAFTWAPEAFSDASMLKQVSEATVLFDKITFSEVSVSFSTDLSPGFESKSFNGSGSGIFGNGIFGNQVFGGNGNSIPFRTLVPREKQRCRYINTKFEHGTAREAFAVYGFSLTSTNTSERAYR